MLPAATDADSAGSNSTSFQVAEAVAYVSSAGDPPIVAVSELLSLIEYPNLPAPYRPPAASADADVLPWICAPWAWLPVWADPYLKSR